MKYIILVAITMVTLNIFAQNDLVRYRPCTSGCGSELNQNFIYGGVTEFITEDVISDYGVRKINQKGSRFHQAIDYTVFGEDANGNKIEDRGYALVAIKGGNVSNINPVNSKSITVGNYRYVHIFSYNSQSDSNGEIYYKSGKFILTQLENNNH